MFVTIKYQMIMFIVMTIVGILFNAMNALAFRFSDLFLSTTLFYGGLLMAANMMWAHEIVHYLSMGHFNAFVFGFGIVLSLLIVFYLLRNQFLVDDKQWFKRMISHHSTAITTTTSLLNKKEYTENNPELRQLARDIIDTQEREIKMMKRMLSSKLN